MSIAASKSNLAKLLAEENLLVEQRKVRTAYFDLNTRTLVLPTLKEELSNDVVDLLVSHEVGHALETPPDGWEDAIKEKKIKPGILNVVEDARIEAFVKRKYPGLKSVYARAYKELMSIDFFGLSKLDISSLNFVDRMNLHFKVGFVAGVEFSEEEQEILNKVEKVKNYGEVMKLSKEIEEFIKNDYKEKVADYKSSLNFDEIEYEESEDFGEEESLFENQENKKSEESQEGDDEEEESGGFGNSSGDDEDQDFDDMEDLFNSYTDDASKDKEKDLYAFDGKETIYVDVPKINIDDYIIHYSIVYSRMNEEVPSIFTSIDGLYNKFKNENASVVSYLAKEFNLKKNASIRKKAKESQSGDINLNKLYSYKVNNDIFKRNTKVQNEKNHSMIFYLDWSGSMDHYMIDTIKQLLCLVMFCKKVNIPYEVYAFTSLYTKEGEYATVHSMYSDEPRMRVADNTVNLTGMNLINLLSYKMSNIDFIKAANLLLSFNGSCFFGADTRYIATAPFWFNLGNTPLNHAILLSDKIAKKFKQETKTDILNNIFLTDGESNQLKFNVGRSYLRFDDRYIKGFLRDKETKITKVIKVGNKLSETNQCVEFVKQSNDFRYFGFRLAGKSEVKNNSFVFFNDWNYSKYWTELKKNNCIKATNTGFDEFYFIRANLIVEDQELNKIEEKESVNSIFKKYDKVVSSKFNNRIFLKKFISFIS